MKRRLLATSAVILGLMCSTVTSPARADQGDIDFNRIFAMADKNQDSMITKEEFLDAMGKAYDMKMAKMKDAKDADKMVKGSAMTRDGLKSLLNDVHYGA